MDKCNNTKFEGVQFQDEGGLFAIRDYHHEGAGSLLNLKIILRVIFHSFMQLVACGLWLVKHGHVTTTKMGCISLA